MESGPGFLTSETTEDVTIKTTFDQRIQRAAEEQHHVAVRDVRQLYQAVDGFFAVEAWAQHRLQGLCDLREERRMHRARHRAP